MGDHSGRPVSPFLALDAISRRFAFSETVSSDRLSSDSGIGPQSLRTTQGSESSSMRIFISAGEPSGDLHAANLIHSLRRQLSRTPSSSVSAARRWQQAGASLLYPAREPRGHVVLERLLNLLTFIRLIFMADRYFRDQRPDAVVLVDYPGLHWWIASRAKARGIPVFYFVPPQIWAWAAGGSRRFASTSIRFCAACPLSRPGITLAASSRLSMWAIRISTS